MPTSEWNSAALFPEPLNERYYLWAHHWEELENGLWSHPGHSPEDDPRYEENGGFTTAEAVEHSREMDALYLQTISSLDVSERLKKTSRSILWSQAARYLWLCEFGDSRDPVDCRDTEAWAKDRLPERGDISDG